MDPEQMIGNAVEDLKPLPGADPRINALAAGACLINAGTVLLAKAIFPALLEAGAPLALVKQVAQVCSATQQVAEENLQALIGALDLKAEDVKAEMDRLQAIADNRSAAIAVVLRAGTQEGNGTKH